jgi:RNA polymerase sigma factor (TIGR02999 family)
MPEEKGDVTLLLHQWQQGSREAENQLFELVVPDLRRLAQYLLRGERQGHSLQPTELVDQIYMRLVAAKNRDWQNRRHFFAIAARAMRRHLIDHARARPDAKFVAVEDWQSFLPADSAKVDLAVTVGRLLDELAGTNPEWCNVVELKYFLGLTDEEAAEVLGVKLRSMQRTWRDARRWLFEHLDPRHGQSTAAR